MYCMEEETKIKIYNTFSVYVVAMQQLDNYLDYSKEHTVLYTSLCTFKVIAFPLWR